MRLNHIKTIATSELKQVWNDKRFLFLLVISPIMACVVFGYVTYRSPEAIDTTVVVDSLQEPVSNQLEQIIDEIDNYERKDGSKPFSVVVEPNSRAEAIKRLDEGKTRAVIVLEQRKNELENVEVIIDATETVVTNEFKQELPKIFDRYSREISINLLSEFIAEQEKSSPQKTSEEASNILSPFDTVFATNEWKELRYFDFYASAMIVILAMSLPLSLSLISITAERSRGTIERIFVSPYEKSEIITGKMLAHSLFAIIFTVLIVGTLKAVFNVTMGNIGLVLLIATLIGINGVILGLLISSVTYSEAESVVIGILCIFGIMGLMTYIVPWETMHPIARSISYIIPFTYGIQTIRQVNMVGLGFSDVWLNLVILFASIIALTLIAIPVLKREIR